MNRIALIVLMAVLALTACNTVEGVGRDVQSAGKGIQNAADRNK